MAESLAWSFTAGASSGAGLSSNGSLASEAVTSAALVLEADMDAAIELALQLDDMDRVAFLAVSPSLVDGTVEVQADGAAPTPLTGPLILYGPAVKLFAGDLTTLKVRNTHDTNSATLSILIGLKLSPEPE